MLSLGLTATALAGITLLTFLGASAQTCQVDEYGALRYCLHFILVVVYFSALLYKYHWEKQKRVSKRVLMEFCLDSSKQILSAILVHYLNVLISAVVSPLILPADQCEVYTINVLMDTTLGLEVESRLLDLATDMAELGLKSWWRQPELEERCRRITLGQGHQQQSQSASGESFRQGCYFGPSKKFQWLWYVKQTAVWLAIVSAMKVLMWCWIWCFQVPLLYLTRYVVLALFSETPYLERLVAVALIPAAMNARQFYFQDSLLQKPASAGAAPPEYHQLARWCLRQDHWMRRYLKPCLPAEEPPRRRPTTAPPPPPRGGSQRPPIQRQAKPGPQLPTGSRAPLKLDWELIRESDSPQGQSGPLGAPLAGSVFEKIWESRSFTLSAAELNEVLLRDNCRRTGPALSRPGTSGQDPSSLHEKKMLEILFKPLQKAGYDTPDKLDSAIGRQPPAKPPLVQQQEAAAQAVLVTQSGETAPEDDWPEAPQSEILEQLAKFLEQAKQSEGRLRKTATAGGLAHVEQFIWQLCQYSSSLDTLEKRVNIRLSMRDLLQKMHKHASQLKTVDEAVQAVIGSHDIQLLLDVVLQFGNYLNHGNRSKGNAIGVELNSLKQLETMKYSAPLGAPEKVPVSRLLLDKLEVGAEFTQHSLREVLDKCSEAHKLDVQAILNGARECMGEVERIRRFDENPDPGDPPALKVCVQDFLAAAAGQSEELAQLEAKVRVDDLRELQKYLALGAERTLPAMLESLVALLTSLLPRGVAGPVPDEAPVSVQVLSMAGPASQARDPLEEWMQAHKFKGVNAPQKTVRLMETFPLHSAVKVKKPDVNIVKLLLAGHADPNAIEKERTTGHRYTPLQLARCKDTNGSHKDVIDELVEAVKRAAASDLDVLD